MIPQSIWTQVWDQLTKVFQGLAAQIQQIIPECSMKAGRNSNDIFPFWAYATFTSPQSVMGIDVSVNCKLSESYVLIWADVAKETGLVLSEFPSRQIAVHTSSTEAEIVQAFGEVEAYLKNQVELIYRELT